MNWKKLFVLPVLCGVLVASYSLSSKTQGSSTVDLKTLSLVAEKNPLPTVAANEENYGEHGRFGRHGEHGRFGRDGEHGRYGRYGEHGRYGRYGERGRYGEHGRWGRWGFNSDSAPKTSYKMPMPKLLVSL